MWVQEIWGWDNFQGNWQPACILYIEYSLPWYYDGAMLWSVGLGGVIQMEGMHAHARLATSLGQGQYLLYLV